MRDPNLRLGDLVDRGKRGREQTKLMNVKVPAHVLGRIDKVAKNLGATKTEVVIAILNEGLESAEKELKGWKPPPKPVVPKERRCSDVHALRMSRPLALPVCRYWGFGFRSA